MEEKSIEIEVSRPTKNFSEHLEFPNNKRIIFSGPFGSGKTYFLKKFFEERSDIYETIHLFPVNYAIASNEDIFELLKYDIFFELLGKEQINYEGIDFTDFFILQNFIYNNSYDILKIIGETINKTNKNFFRIIDRVVQLEKKYNQFRNKSNETDKIQIINYLKQQTQKKGSIYEEDAYTELISNLVTELKNNASPQETKKKSVLIIDDLDRIDPEHIFRLLNVFAAHFDINSGNNKFNFDKIIFVCDHTNIKNIFHAKYGMEADYVGYIDKFYSHEIFCFDNINAIIKKIADMFELTIERPKDLAPGTIFYELTTYLIKSMVDKRIIQTRSLVKLLNTKVTFKNQKIVYEGNTIEVYIIEVFELLRSILGSSSNLSTGLTKLAKFELTETNKDPKDHNHQYKLGALLPILDYRNHHFNKQDNQTLRFHDRNPNLFINYEIVFFQNLYSTVVKCDVKKIEVTHTITSPPINIQLFRYTLETFEILRTDFSLFID